MEKSEEHLCVDAVCVWRYCTTITIELVITMKCSECMCCTQTHIALLDAHFVGWGALANSSTVPWIALALWTITGPPTYNTQCTDSKFSTSMHVLYSMHVLAVTQVCVHVWALKASATYNCDRVNAIHSIACTPPLPLQRRPLVSTPHWKLLHSHVSPKYIDPGSCITISEQRGAWDTWYHNTMPERLCTLLISMFRSFILHI